MDCKYSFLGHSSLSYSQLIDVLELLGNTLFLNESISDIVYSKVLKQKHQVDNLKKIKKDYIPKQPSIKSLVEDILSGEPNTGTFGIMNFLDSDMCTRKNGTRLVTPMNREEYVKSQIKHLVESLGMDKEKAEKQLEEEVKLWETAQINSFELHLLFTDGSVVGKNYSDFSTRAEAVLQHTDISETALQKLHTELHHSYMVEKGKYARSETVSNLNFKSKLHGYDIEIHGHIGYVFVGEDGVLHLQIYKTTLDNPHLWSETKMNKYRYHAAFLLAMLAEQSDDPDMQISIKNATVDIIPVQLKYNESKRIDDVHVYGAIRVTSNSFGTYALDKYARDVKSFIKYNNVARHISSDPIQEALRNCLAIFPEINIREDGIETSASLWIKYAPNIDPEGNEPLVIKISEDPDYAYEVIINGHSYMVKEKSAKTRNKEIFELVNRYVRDLDSNRTYVTLSLKDAIKQSYVAGFGTFDKIKGIRGRSEALKRALSKYFYYVKDEKTGNKTYTWELLDNLADSNILLFKNKLTGVIDVISLSSYPLTTQAKLRVGTNILGHYKVDGEWNRLQGTYGNILTITTMEYLNEILPVLGDDITLGTLGVLSLGAQVEYRTHHIGEFNKNYFNEVITTVNNMNSDVDIKNNFIILKVKFEDPIQSILDEFTQITEIKYPDTADRLDAAGFSDLEEAETREEKAYALQKLMTQILSEHPEFGDYNELQKALNPINGMSTDVNNLAKLFDLISRAYLYVSGETPKYIDKLSAWDINSFTAPTVPDANIQIVVNNLQITHDTIASEFLSEYDKYIRKTFDTFYNEIGYTHALNMSIGNQAQQYSNVFEKDENGNNLFIFKNPYDLSNDLSSAERKMLKEVLFRIADIHSNGNFHTKYSPNLDVKMRNYIKQHPEYLWVPLEKASKATLRQSGKAIVNKMKNFWKRIMNPKEAFDEFVQGVDPVERSAVSGNETDFYTLSLRNPFASTMVTSLNGFGQAQANRAKLLEEYGPEYFETNVENILIDFLAKHISTTLLNKLLVTSKALLVLLQILGDMAGNKNIIEKEVNYIQDYLRVNVFKKSIMDETSLKVLGVVQPAKKIVTDMLLGGNIISALRDTLEGLQQTFLRSAIKFNTDISASNLAKAYAYVWKNSTSDAMAINLLSKLCLKYRISNTDVGRIAERAKSGRNGIFNYDNWLYSTLRSPDFLNRMTLFVAKCMQDGSWDAWSIDEDDNLKYDWKEDKRFSIYALGLTNHEDYNSLKALYYSCIRSYNEDHPDATIAYTEDLPLPYSDKEINNIKNAGDNIFGSYDRSKKSMAENYAIGISFGMFTTWMNGIWNNYMMKPQENGVTKFLLVLETNEKGEKLFFTKDGGITTEDTGLIVWKQVPVTVLGILYTVIDAARLVRLDSWASAWNYIKSNPVARANMLKLLSDLLMWGLMALLFGKVLTPAYKDYKKNDMANNSILLNLVTEIVYKASNKSYDLYKGLVNVMQFFGEETSPAWYSVPSNVISETYKAIIGEKSWKYLVFDNAGLMRTFRDTGMTVWKLATQ